MITWNPCFLQDDAHIFCRESQVSLINLYGGNLCAINFFIYKRDNSLYFCTILYEFWLCKCGIIWWKFSTDKYLWVTLPIGSSRDIWTCKSGLLKLPFPLHSWIHCFGCWFLLCTIFLIALLLYWFFVLQLFYLPNCLWIINTIAPVFIHCYILLHYFFPTDKRWSYWGIGVHQLHLRYFWIYIWVGIINCK